MEGNGAPTADGLCRRYLWDWWNCCYSKLRGEEGRGLGEKVLWLNIFHNIDNFSKLYFCLVTGTTSRSFFALSWPNWWLWQRPCLQVLQIHLNSNAFLFPTPFSNFKKCSVFNMFFLLIFPFVGSHKDIEWYLVQVSSEKNRNANLVHFYKPLNTTKG